MGLRVNFIKIKVKEWGNDMAKYEFFLVSSLEKVFPNQRPKPLDIKQGLTGLLDECVSMQLVYRVEDAAFGMPMQEFEVTIKGAPCRARLRDVKLVPADYVCYAKHDDNYITTDPGLFPDLLTPFEGKIKPIYNQFRSVWIDFSLKDITPGEYTVTLSVKADPSTLCGNGVEVKNEDAVRQNWEQSISLTVLDAKLPEQTLLHTEWFHTDCLANYYHVESFSERHWEIIENFIRHAGEECGINMLLTPIFTQPLDTVVGGERTTVQLVKITKQGETYLFNFDDLHRWCELCKKYGITHLEIAHFFTQWGAYATPKIMITIEGEEKRMFGWDVPATSKEYRLFLEAFVPALLAFLKGEGYEREQLRFHISDEPTEKHLESYLAAKNQISDLLEGYIIMDALSSYEFYKRGIVSNPIPANDHIQPFIDQKVDNLWVYYCCAQGDKVPNRFLAMPSARNRIMGVLMYLYDIKGFLHWGYNFYNTQFSKAPLNPYCDTHADFAFPAGDPFLVYPADDGTVYSSIRNQVQMEGYYDMRALTLLEHLSSREVVIDIILEGVKGEMTFKQYPRSAEYLLSLRRRVNEEIAKRIG